MTEGTAWFLPYRIEEPGRNMAWDAALLEEAPVPLLRLYGWSPPAISIGRFQGRRNELGMLLGTPYGIVRRMTGGGAIVHDRELTYAIAVGDSHPVLAGASRAESYAALSSPVACALRDLGVEVSTGGGRAASGSPVLCFQRVAPTDLVHRGRKLAGSAQRRTRGRILQHGSLLLAPNEHQPGPVSLREIPAFQASLDALVERILHHYGRMFGALRVWTPPGDAVRRVEEAAGRFRVRMAPDPP